MYNMYAEYNWDDPIYKIVRRETASPRYKLFLLQKKELNIIFFQYTDALALQSKNDTPFDALFREQRTQLINEGITTDANERLVKHFLEKKIPYKDDTKEEYAFTDIWCG